MYACLSRALGAASLIALLAGCTGTSRTDTIPPSTAPAMAPVSPGIATPPVAAAPVGPVVPGAGTSGSPGVPGARIGEAETAGLIGGNTTTGIAADGQPYYAWFGPDGQVRFRQGKFVDAGTWRVGPDGRFCTTMTKTNGGAEECYYLYRTNSATAIRFDRVDGTTLGTFSVLPGNPQSL
jgi:hypothetical protein